MVHHSYVFNDMVHKCVDGTVTLGHIESDVENLTGKDVVYIKYRDGTTEVLTKDALDHRAFIYNLSGSGDPPKYLCFASRAEFVEYSDEYDAHNRFGGKFVVPCFGPKGMEGGPPLNMFAFFQYTKMVRLHCEKWYEDAVGPLYEMGVDRNEIGYDAWEKMLKKVLCGIP